MKGKARTRTTAVFISCAAAVVLICVLFWHSEPEYEGRRLRVWLNELTTSDEEGRALAKEAILAMGSKSVPTLVRLLRSIDSTFRRKAMPWLSKQSLIRIDFNEWENQIHGAMIAFFTLGPEASSALPDLIELLPRQTWLAASAIAAMGPAVAAEPMARDAIPALIANLKEVDRDTRDAVMGALIAIGHDTVRPLIAALSDPDAIARKHAAQTLGKLASLPQRTVPALNAALADSEPQVRQAAATALSAFDSDALDAVPALAELLNDPSAQVRIQAAKTIARISPDHTEALGFLMELLRDETPRPELARAIGEIGPNAHTAIPVIVHAFKNSSKRSDSAIAEARKAATSGKGETNALDRLLWSEGYFRSNLAQALGKMGPAAAKAVPLLAGALADHQDYFARSDAADALGQIGIPARTAVPELISAVNDSNSNMRWHAIAALAAIDPENDAVLGTLVRSLTDENKEVRLNVVQALAMMQTGRMKRIDALVRATRDPNHEVRLAALRSLSTYGPDAAAALPALTRLLNDRFRSVREAAILAMHSLAREP